jgi:NAD(P)H-hydrate epimerase
MRLATAADVKRLDERAEKEFGISRTVLMENAGLSVALAMERTMGSLEGKRVTLLCGRGGNGGDGFVAARHLVSHGASVVIGLVGGREGLAGEPQAFRAILEKTGLAPQDITADKDVPWVRAAASAADIVVDALMGTGSRLPVTGLMEQVIRTVNEAGRPVVSVDIPSGLNPDTGAVPGACIQAVLTVALGLPKRGLVLYPGTLFTGKLVMADLTFPAQLLTDESIRGEILLPDEAAHLLPLRHPQAHKHAVGRVLVVAGSRAMSGAAALAAEGALVAGAGLVHLASPRSSADALRGRRPELLIHPQAETPTGNLAEAALDELLALGAKMRAVALGPGLGGEETTRKAATRLMELVEAPMVVDADALNALAASPAVLKTAKGPRVITPHSGEMARLLETTAEAVEADRMGAAARAADKYGSIAVLKGARTVVAEPGGRIFVIPTGNAGMATGGTGDVLTGIIAGLMAQRLVPVAASLLGAYLHGLAGDIARDERTELSVTASDVAARVPAAFRRIRTGTAPGEEHKA